MREIRLSGSEGGGAGTNRPSLPLSKAARQEANVAVRPRQSTRRERARLGSRVGCTITHSPSNTISGVARGALRRHAALDSALRLPHDASQQGEGRPKSAGLVPVCTLRLSRAPGRR